ncbi:MAG: bifunctional oligoribonuclease/PAP phosphatase NrnA [Synergistaceae bacterium]|jgi:phosphoesterase RecJ-like protein|nr:bifunctional oligoribonuclease/PAP phosphatase NrnA [Synergistaceae bacterium]
MLEDILDILQKSDRWLIISHEKPDGDTIGCGAALMRLGKRLSKEVVFACADPCPTRYSFLLDDIEFTVLRGMPEDFPGSGGVVVCVDTSNAARSMPGLRERPLSCPIINIDHHIDNERYGDINWVEPTASATGEMVTELLTSSPWGMTEDEAVALYVAMVSDNGSFSFASTTLKSHDYAMKLLEAGVSPNRIAEELESNLTADVLRLWGAAMTRATTFADGNCAIYWLSREDFIDTGTSRQSTENLVNFLLRIKGVRMVALCSELMEPDGSSCAGVRASIRARSPFNAREVASIFGGGGHDLAAGCTIMEPLPEAVSLLRQEMETHVSRPHINR